MSDAQLDAGADERRSGARGSASKTLGGCAPADARSAVFLGTKDLGRARARRLFAAQMLDAGPLRGCATPAGWPVFGGACAMAPVSG